MKVVRELEPGILPAFRVFIGIQLGVSVLNVITHWLAPYWVQSEVFRLPMLSMFGVLIAGLLLLYLLVPSLQRVLGDIYLPIAILWATVGAFLETYVELHSAGNNVSEMRISFVFLRQIVLLLIPLIVVSWQYSMRHVVLFCMLAAALNIILLSQILLLQELISGLLLGIVGIQVIVFLLVGYMVENLVRVQREQRQSLIEANQRLAQYASTLEQLAISRERNRLAHELHDTLAHSLSGVAVQLEAIDTILDTNPDEAKALLQQSLATTRSGLNETRRALRALRAGPLEDLGLALAMRSLAESVASRNGLKLSLDVPEHLENLSPELEQDIYRVAQEALENVARHAQAKNVKVRLSQNKDQLELIISDNGRGFDPSKIDAITKFGIQGMRERTEMLGGNLEVDSRPEGGTMIRLVWKGAT